MKRWGWMCVWAIGLSLCGSVAHTADTANAPAWEVQGDWLVNTQSRCQLQKPAADGWLFEQDAAGAWRIVHRTPTSTVMVMCMVSQEKRRLQELAQTIVADAYQQSTDHFLPSAQATQRSTTVLKSRAIQINIAGPHTGGAWRTDRYLLFKRSTAVVTLHAASSPEGAYDADRAAIDAIFSSLTWF